MKAHSVLMPLEVKVTPTTQEDCRWVVCSYGHLLPVQAEGSDERVTGAQFAQMIRDNYDMTFTRNFLAAYYAEDGISEVWNRRFAGDLGDGFNWTLNSWVEWKLRVCGEVRICWTCIGHTRAEMQGKATAAFLKHYGYSAEYILGGDVVVKAGREVR